MTTKYHPMLSMTGCFTGLFQALASLFGGGTQPSQTVVNQQVPNAPPAPPANSADAPTPDDKKSGELEDARADATGFGALIIPRTAFQAVTRNVPSG